MFYYLPYLNKTEVFFMKPHITPAILLACLLTAGTLLSCGSDTDKTVDTGSSTGTAAAQEESTGEPDPFDAFDFGGEEIRFWVNANDYYGSGPSSYLIIDDEETAGDIVNDAVIERNGFVEELLNVKLIFTECEYDWSEIIEPLTNTIAAGDDAYDVIVHDLFPMANMAVSGYFANVRNGAHFNFSQDYWYEDYMGDLCFGSTKQNYIMAGDFFLDIIRSAPALYVNKDMFNTLYESADELYDHVLNKTWTLDVFHSYIKDTYADLNGDAKADHEDRYGFGYIGKWGSLFPFVISADLTYLEYESDGSPVFAMDNERSVKLLEILNEIYYDPSAHDYNESVDQNNQAFMNGNVLFGGYQRIASLEMFRDMEASIGILPIPMFDEAQGKYVTATHDITQIGVIPTTCSKLDTVSAVLEVLSRETKSTVMPAYYDSALKIKYARDDISSQMLDIIRDGLDNAFPLAYNNYTNNFILADTFATPVSKNNTDFMSNYTKKVKAAQPKLDALWDAYSSLED